MHKVMIHGFAGEKQFTLDLLLNAQDLNELLWNGLKHAVTPTLIGEIKESEVRIDHVSMTYIPTSRFKIDP